MTDDTDRRLTIFEAIPAIMAELPAIGKDSEMKDGQYNYRGIDDILPHTVPLFAKHGVFIAPIYEVIESGLFTTRTGSVMHRSVVKGSFWFYASDGSRIAAQTIGEALDVSDKSINKAETAAYKYAILQVLGINGGDDPDDYRPETAEAVAGGQVTYQNYDKLAALGPVLKALTLHEEVKAWAADQGIDLRPGHDEENLAKVVEFATATITNVLQVPGGEPAADAPADPIAETQAALERLHGGFGETTQVDPESLPEPQDDPAPAS